MEEADDRRNATRKSNITKFAKLFGSCAKPSDEINPSEEQQEERGEESGVGLLPDNAEEGLTGESFNNDSDVDSEVEDIVKLNVFSIPEYQDEVIS